MFDDGDDTAQGDVSILFISSCVNISVSLSLFHVCVQCGRTALYYARGKKLTEVVARLEQIVDGWEPK